MAKVGYNERSWAIDLIIEINQWCSKRDLVIKRAGGENTLKSENNNLFPDVLLFGGTENEILQGWELKFPDTSINDKEFINNAKKKASLLELNSFLLWNVSNAVLYKKDEKTGEYTDIKVWDDCNHITQRKEAKKCEDDWCEMLNNILQDLVYYLENNIIKSSTIISSLTGEGISNIIINNRKAVSNKLKEVSKHDQDFDDKLTLWWLGKKNEYPEFKNREQLLSQLIILSWMNKFIFAHLLKNIHKTASSIDNIKEDISIDEAIKIIQEISSECDFLNIFKSHLGEIHLPENVWRQLVSFNEFLIDLRLGNISQDMMQELLGQIVVSAKKSLAGQYSTPKELAALLVALTIENKGNNVIDPCCGTGTIPRAAYNLKNFYGYSSNEIINTVWASDKFTFPVHLTTLAITDPNNMGEIVQVFQKDIFDIKVGKNVELFEPNSGEVINVSISHFNNIVSNLPFVQQEDKYKLNPTLEKVNQLISDIAEESLEIPGRSDLYSYIILYLWALLEKNGKVGVIIYNSWTSTDWGEDFIKILRRFFEIELIVTSGKGKWFENTDVVTNILVLRKKCKNKIVDKKDNMNEKVSFVTLKNYIEDITKNEEGKIDQEKVRETSAKIRQYKNKNTNTFSKITYTSQELNDLKGLGLRYNSMFANNKWLLSISNKLIKVNDLFEIKRGTRRGWNKLFYPEEGHGIETEYIKPVVRSSSEIDGYITKAKSEAFCCTLSKEKLDDLGHTGALNWIRSFENKTNNVGVPLTESLDKLGIYWYTMLPNTLADFVLSINPDERLFIAKLKERSFVDQRLTRFTKKNDNTNIELAHALLNSLIGIFYIEALGFGRGLGALDLNTTKIKKNLFMLNPSLLKKNQKEKITKKFSVLVERNVLALNKELENKDRIDFDNAVLEAYGIKKYKKDIKNSLLQLYSIRKSVND